MAIAVILCIDGKAPLAIAVMLYGTTCIRPWIFSRNWSKTKVWNSHKQNRTGGDPSQPPASTPSDAPPRPSNRCERPGRGLRLSNVEAEVYNVPLPYYVVLALAPEQTFLFRRLLASTRHEVVVAYSFRPDETPARATHAERAATASTLILERSWLSAQRLHHRTLT